MKKNTKEVKAENGSAAVIVLTAILALLIGIGIGFGIKYLIDENSDDMDTNNTSKNRVLDDEDDEDDEIENSYNNKNSTNSVKNSTSNVTNTATNTSNSDKTISIAGYTFSLPNKYTIYSESGSGSSKLYRLIRNNDENSVYGVKYAGSSTFEYIKSNKQKLLEEIKAISGVSNINDVYDNTYNGYNYIYVEYENSGYPDIFAMIEFDTNQILILEYAKKSGTVTTTDINVFIDEVIKNKTSSTKSNISVEEESGDVFDAIDGLKLD